MISIEHLAGLGEALKELRWRMRMKQVDVCRATGMTAPQVSRYENGRETPTVESLIKYLNAVGADFADLQRVLTAEPGAEPSSRLEHGSGPSSRLAGGRRQEGGSPMIIEREGMERLEHRMRSLEDWMLEMKKVSE